MSWGSIAFTSATLVNSSIYLVVGIAHRPALAEGTTSPDVTWRAVVEFQPVT